MKYLMNLNNMVEEIDVKYELEIFAEDNLSGDNKHTQMLDDNSKLFNVTNYFGSNTCIPFETIDEIVPEVTQNKLTQLSNVEFHTETVVTKAAEFNRNLLVDSGSDITSNEALVYINDNLDLGIDIRVPAINCNSRTIIPDLIDDTFKDNILEPMQQCWNSEPQIYLNDSLNIKKTDPNSELLNLNAKCLLSKWRERIRNNLLFCKQCAISFQNIRELRSHNGSIHNLPNNNDIATGVKSVKQFDKTKTRKEKVKKPVRKRNIKPDQCSSKLKIHKERLFHKNNIKSLPFDTDEEDDFEPAKYRTGCRRRKRNGANPTIITDDILSTKGYICINPMVPIGDIMITFKEKNGKTRKIQL